ncbi:MAG: ABC transporter permease [Catenulispora sp.]
MSSDTLAPPVPVGGGGLPTVLHDAWVVTLRNLRRMTRMPEMVVFSSIQPVMFVLLFAFVFGGAIPVPGAEGKSAYREFLLPGIFVQTLCFTAATTSVGLADDLHKGLIDRFRSLPIARSAVLAGRTTADWLQNLFVLVVMAVCGVVVGWRINNGFPKAVAGFVLLMLFAYAMSWIGAVIGLSVRTVEAANTIGFIWIFPLTFLSNAFVPARTLSPQWLQDIADWNPVSATVQALRGLWGNPDGYAGSGKMPWPIEHASWVSLFWSVLLLAVFIPLSVRKYRSVSA